MTQDKTATLLRHASALALLAGLLSSCSMAPEYQRPESPVSPTFRSAGTAEPALTAPTSQWWTSFANDELTALVERALANNHDIKAAAQRVIQAEQLAKEAGASLLPTLGFVGSQSAVGPSGGVGTVQSANVPFDTARKYSAGLRASYEVDLWGRNASSEDAAIANAQASEYDRQSLTLSLISDVVNTYFTVLALKDLTVIAETNRDNSRNTLDAVTARAGVQEATQIELHQQRATVARNESRVASYRLQLDQTINRLAILLGASPSQPLVLKETSLKPLSVPRVDSSMPSELLLRRPDISKAEAMLRGANANIGVARSSFLPSFSLTGEGGRGGFSLTSLLSPQSLYFSLASSLTQMIFDGGRAAAREKYSEARYAELIEGYRQAVLNALMEVESALVAETMLAEQENADLRQLDASRNAYGLTRTAFGAGRIDYQTLLETQRTQLASEETAALTRLSRLRNAVALFKAVAGDTKVAAKTD